MLFTGLVASLLAIEELLHLLVLEVEDRVSRQADVLPVCIIVQPLKSLRWLVYSLRSHESALRFRVQTNFKIVHATAGD